MSAQTLPGLTTHSATDLIAAIVQDHFIFKVEGTGALPCRHIVLTALQILRGKMDALIRALPEED